MQQRKKEGTSALLQDGALMQYQHHQRSSSTNIISAHRVPTSSALMEYQHHQRAWCTLGKETQA